MREIAGDLKRWLAAGERIALLTVVWAAGPSPRLAGTRFAVTASGQMAGSVSGGGCLEGGLLEEAQAVLQGEPPRRRRFGAVDEASLEVGLSCGGTIEVYVEPLADTHRRLLQALEADEICGLATRMDGRGHLLAWTDGRLEGDRSLATALTSLFPGPATDLRPSPVGEAFCQVFVPAPVIVVVGAVHIAMDLVALAQVLGYRVRVVDPRRAFATRERFPMADELEPAWPQDALCAEELGPQHAIVVLSHDPKFDLPALQIALRSKAGYIGLLGSPTTQAKRRRALREEGFTEEDLARIRGPVGLDLGGREPAEIALAILAEIVAVQHGRQGAKLS